MSAENIEATSSTSNPSVNAPSSADAVTAGAIASTQGSKEATAATKVGSIADLKKTAPEVYDQMIKSIAWSICRQMKKQQERLKQMMDEGRRRS